MPRGISSATRPPRGPIGSDAVREQQVFLHFPTDDTRPPLRSTAVLTVFYYVRSTAVRSNINKTEYGREGKLDLSVG